MKVRNIVLGGVAAVALAGAFAVPGFAQYAGNPPQYSTPAEKAQTQQLNAQAQDGTTASPAALNGDAQGATMDQAHRDQQQARYQAQQAQYRDDMARYHAMHRQYERNIHRYDEARFYFTDYPHRLAYRYDDLRPLYTLPEPSEQLANAPIEDRDGEWVGRIRSVATGVDGRPIRIEVALNHRVSVWLNPDALRFDARDKVAFTDLTRADLWNMPGAPFNG